MYVVYVVRLGLLLLPLVVVYVVRGVGPVPRLLVLVEVLCCRGRLQEDVVLLLLVVEGS